MLLFFSCSQARNIARTAEQASQYRQQAAEQLQNLEKRSTSQNWFELPEQQGLELRLNTTKGIIDIQLAFRLAPLAVSSFLYLVGYNSNDNNYNGMGFHRPGNDAPYVQTDENAILPAFPAEFSEWLHFQEPGILAFTSSTVSLQDAWATDNSRSNNPKDSPNNTTNQTKAQRISDWPNTFNQSSFFISLESRQDLFGRFSAFGSVKNNLEVARKLQTGDQIISIEVYAHNSQAEAFLAELRRDGLDMLRRLRTKVMYERNGIAAIHQKLAQNFASVYWPRYQKYKLKQPPINQKSQVSNPKEQQLQSSMRDWGLEYKVLKAGHGQKKMIEMDAQQLKIQYAVWATQNNGQSLLLEDRIQNEQELQVNLWQLFPAWQAALLDMRPGEKRLYVIPPEGAYGIRGWAPNIPPWAYLIMELHLNTN